MTGIYVLTSRGQRKGRSDPKHCRLDDKVEYIFHFVITRQDFKSNIGEVREPYADTYIKENELSNETQ